MRFLSVAVFLALLVAAVTSVSVDKSFHRTISSGPLAERLRLRALRAGHSQANEMQLAAKKAKAKCAHKDRSGCVQGPPPTINGCGPADTPNLHKVLDGRFTTCCNGHDECYGTCGSTVETCDDTFHSCMLNLCAPLDGVSKTLCNAQAHTFYTAVSTVGCSIFENDQENSCHCPGSSTGAAAGSDDHGSSGSDSAHDNGDNGDNSSHDDGENSSHDDDNSSHDDGNNGSQDNAADGQHTESSDTAADNGADSPHSSEDNGGSSDT